MVTKDKLVKVYKTRGLGLKKTAMELGLTVRKIRTLIKRFDIEPNPFHLKGRGNRVGTILSDETKKKISDAHMGKKLSAETRAKISSHGRGWYINNGYMFLRMPEHHLAFKYKGYVKRAVIEAETKFGWLLKENELVHHINGNRLDDSQSNLEIMTFSEHNSLTAKERWASGELREVLSRRSKRKGV